MSNRCCIADGKKFYDTPYISPNRPRVFTGYNPFPFTDGVECTCQYTAYFERQLFTEVLSVMDSEIPAWWDKDFTLWCLFRLGFFGIIDTPDFGKIPQPARIGAERNVFYMPTRAMITNPLIEKTDYTIGVDCAIVKLNPDFGGVWDLIHSYAERMAYLLQSSQMNVANSRLVWFLASTTKASSDTMKEILSRIDRGEPAIITDARLFSDANDKKGDGTPWKEFHNDVGANYINGQLLDDLEKTVDMFKREIGVPVMSDKKERMLTDEVKAETQYSLTKLDVWIDTLNRSLEKAFEVFPDLRGQISFKVHEVPNEEETEVTNDEM